MTQSPGPRPRSSSGSAAGDNANDQGTKAPKDKQCPFCHQAFTSSSLGRHLDLYIKPKNPKPADGVHDVRRIREIRGKITRRQPRNSLKRQEQDDDNEHSSIREQEREYDGDNSHSYGHDRDPSEINSTPLTKQGRQVGVRLPQQVAAGALRARPPERGTERDADMLSPSVAFTGNHDALRGEEKIRMAFGTANWQGTGVISGLPPHSADMDRFQRPPSNSYGASTTPVPNWHNQPPHQPGRRPLSRQPHPYRGSDPPRSTSYGDVDGRAAEMALQHVLSSLEAARSTSANTGGPTSPATLIFDFDYHGHTFPSLVLRVLPSPRTLFSLSPFATPETWPLDPPDETTLQAMRAHISTRAAALPPAAGKAATGGPGAHPDRTPSAVIAAETARARAHLEGSYAAWDRLSPTDKKRAWELEVLRAYALATKRVGERTAELRLARQQAEYFRRQHERLLHAVEVQGGPGAQAVLAAAAAAAAEPLAVPGELYDALERGDPEVRDWSYEGLLGKWRDKARLEGSREWMDGGAGGGGSSGATTMTPVAACDSVLQRPVASEAIPDADVARVNGGDGLTDSPTSKAGTNDRHIGDGFKLRAGIISGVKGHNGSATAPSGPPEPRGSGMHVDGEQVAPDDGVKVNGNGKRARPPSWSDTPDENTV